MSTETPAEEAVVTTTPADSSSGGAAAAGAAAEEEEKKKEEEEEEKKYDSEEEEKKMDEAALAASDGGIAVDQELLGDVNEMDLIREDIAKTQPLVSESKSLEFLLNQYEGNKNFSRQITNLIKMGEHDAYRQLRGDGSCFYRAFMLGLFEHIEMTGDLDLLATVTKNATSSCQRLVDLGYDEIALDTFYEMFMDELGYYQSKLLSGDPSTFKSSDGNGNSAAERICNDSLSQYLLFWARMLTAVYILENSDFFAAFCFGMDIQSFVKSSVEASHSEADHPQFVALAQSLGVPVRVICLENVDSGGPQIVCVPDDGKPVFDLLYRPGHYDLLTRVSK